MRIVDFNQVNRHHKKANKLALDYYLKDVTSQVRSKLLLLCYSEYYDEPLTNLCADDIFRGKTATIHPLPVIFDYNRRIISVSNKTLIKYAKAMFNRYLKQLRKSSYGIMISKTDRDGTAIRTIIKLENRYCSSYHNMIGRRMKWLCYKYGNSLAVLLTLTLDPARYNGDKLRMWLDIKPQYHRFITGLKYHFKKENRDFPMYVCSIEAQKNGNPHLHIVFLGASRLIDWRKIRDLWHQGFIYINRTYDGKKIRYPINYITKYITKTFSETTEGNLLTQALSWLFNVRSFQCSRGLIFPLKSISSNEWIATYFLIIDNDVDYSILNANVDILEQLINPLILK